MIFPLGRVCKSRRDLEATFRVFQVQMVPYFRQEKYHDVLFTGIPIRVFIELEPALRRQFSNIAVDMAQKGWDIIIDKITVPQLVEHIAAMYGSPSEAWDYLAQYYGVSLTAHKAPFEVERHTLEMGLDESSFVFLSKPISSGTKARVLLSLCQT